MRWRDVKAKQNQPKKEAKKSPIVASFSARVMGFTTDLFMIGMPITLLGMVIFGYDQVTNTAGMSDVLLNPEEAALKAPSALASAFQFSLYCLAFVIFWRVSGQTPGKKFAAIKVVDANTLERASVLKLIVRFLMYFISILSVVGFFTGLLRKDGRALHDLLSGTMVIRAVES